MRRRALPALTSAAAAAVSMVLAAPASATVAVPVVPRDGEVGGAAARNSVAATTPDLRASRSAADASAAEVTTVQAGGDQPYPRQTALSEPPVNTADAAIKLGLTPYHEIARRLNALQAESDRVSVEVVGQSTLGRDLYLVTVTAPETAEQAREQARLRRLIEEDPTAAAADAALPTRYKAPYLVNGNIHGDEYEGADGILRVVEELARSTDPAVGEMLGRTRVHAVVSMNPDGRVANTRANAAGFDMNRDFITASQPEVVAVRDTIIDVQPLVLLDQHGYVAGTLIEPTTAPHGQNYEYDLFIKHALPNGEAMEAALLQAVAEGRIPDAREGEIAPVIPFRDYEPGDWDDWPPIFTPQYAAFHGAVSHTVEVPLRVNRGDYAAADTPEEIEELQRRSRVNTAVVVETVMASLDYTDVHREELIADQIEVFRRGSAGEPSRDLPVGLVEGWGPEDQGYTTEFPRAYVIRGGSGQRSAAAAARLVDHLVANDVRVTRAERQFALGGHGYAAGSYVVDMHQPKRGLANVMLEAGRDISDRVPQMYDISGWSHGLLWGASVDAVTSGDLPVTTPVVAAAPTGGVTARPGQSLALTLHDARDAQALNALLDEGVPARMTADGTVVLPASSRSAAVRVADQYGVRMTPAGSAGDGVPLEDLTVAASVSADELQVLRDLGFEVLPVSTGVLNSGFDWQGVDVLFVSAGLDRAALTPVAAAALDAFLADGGVVTRGSTGAAFNEASGLLTATAARGRGDANGVVSVENEGGPVTSGALPHSFVYGPSWFSGLGGEVAVEQRYSPTDVLVAGHWLPDEATGLGQEDAAGQASIIRGEDESGASVVMFGTEPMFRDHPKGLYGQVARSLHFTAATAGVDVAAP